MLVLGLIYGDSSVMSTKRLFFKPCPEIKVLLRKISFCLLVTIKWRNRKSSLELRLGSTGCSINSKFFVFGGNDSNSCEYYCPQEDTWRPLLKMKEDRWLAEDDNTPANIYIEPFDGELTDEDSADEDEGGAIDNLSSNPGC
ncbi:hypothetical protein GQR58_014554 [Nymphon striatum]|nr:hypothetical protein GQR58_014554 [Nymphon striatum]